MRQHISFKLKYSKIIMQMESDEMLNLTQEMKVGCPRSSCSREEQQSSSLGSLGRSRYYPRWEMLPTVQTYHIQCSNILFFMFLCSTDSSPDQLKCCNREAGNQLKMPNPTRIDL